MESIAKSGVALILSALAWLSGAACAGGPVFADTFTNGVAAPFWRQFAHNPAVLRSTEQNGRLEFSTTASASGEEVGAGYFAKGWRMRTTSDIRARVDFKGGTNSGVSSADGSVVGLGIALYMADIEPLDNVPHDGLVIALMSVRQGAAVYRTLVIVWKDSFGEAHTLLSSYALPSSPTIFRDSSTNEPIAVIATQGTLYLQYISGLDKLLLSTVGYDDPDALFVRNLIGPTQFPVQLGIGSNALKPGTLMGANAWFDNLYVDEADVEAAAATVNAADGSSTEGVAIAWTTASGATGYRIYRSSEQSGRETVGEVGAGATSYLDTTGVPGLVYDYEVESQTASGTGYSTFDTGWRNTTAPGGVAATQGTLTGGVTVEWNANEEASAGYRVLRAVGAGAAVSIGTTTDTSFTDATAVAGQAYVYTVKSRTAGGDSAASAGVIGYRSLAAPTNVAATDGTLVTGVNVTWTAVAGASGYRVWRSDGGDFVSIGTPTASPFLDTTATAGTTYTYKVSARTAAGNSIASATNAGWRNVAAPANVLASDGTSSSAVTVTWNALAGVTGYRVYRTIGAGIPVEIADTSETTATDETAVPGTVYSYRVYAYTASGESAGSTANTGWRNILAPTGLAAADGTSTSGVALAWDAADGATGYLVFRKAGSAAPTQIASVGAAVLAYNDTTAAAGTVYTYTVKAKTVPGSSEASAGDTGWRSLPLATVTATDGTLTTGVTVTWTAVTGATGYKVYRLVDADYVLQGTTAAAVRTYADTSVEAGVVSTYKVSATSAAGESLGKTDTGWRNVAAPANLAAGDGASPTQTALTWDAVPGATGYRIYRALGTAAPVELGTTISAGYSDATGIQGKVYAYSVKATTAAGNSASSAANTGWRNVAAPINVQATDGTYTNKVRVIWTISPETVVTGYEVWRSVDMGAPARVASIASRATVLYDDTTLPLGTVGTYTVRAKTAAGVSEDSEPDDGDRGGFFRSTEGGSEPQAGAGAGAGAREGTAEVATSGGHGDAGRNRAGGTGETHGRGGTAGEGSVDDGSNGRQDGAGADLPRRPEAEVLVARIAARIEALERDDAAAAGAELEELRTLAGDPETPEDSPAARMLAGDITLDGTVDAGDLATFLIAWREGDAFHADLDRNGAIDDADLLLATESFLAAMLGAPEAD